MALLIYSDHFHIILKFLRLFHTLVREKCATSLIKFNRNGSAVYTEKIPGFISCFIWVRKDKRLDIWLKIFPLTILALAGWQNIFEEDFFEDIGSV